LLLKQDSFTRTLYENEKITSLLHGKCTCVSTITVIIVVKYVCFVVSMPYFVI